MKASAANTNDLCGRGCRKFYHSFSSFSSATDRPPASDADSIDGEFTHCHEADARQTFEAIGDAAERARVTNRGVRDKR